MQKEIWKDIPDYEGFYQASSLGRIKSLSRRVNCKGGTRVTRDRIIKTTPDKDGYLSVCLCVRGKKSRGLIHRLVLSAFIGCSSLQTDHINSIKDDNRLENLEYVTARENCRRRSLSIPSSSKYIGVSWNTREQKWEVAIWFNGTRHYLGKFKDELEASKAYQQKLELVTNQDA